MKKKTNFGQQNFSFRVLLSFCLTFCQFKPGVAYEKVPYKKACTDAILLF